VIDSLSNSLDRPDKFVQLYAILSCIRLLSSQPVLVAAEACCRRIVDFYSKPNLSVDQIGATLEEDNFDPLKEFSAARNFTSSRAKVGLNLDADSSRCRGVSDTVDTTGPLGGLMARLATRGAASP
jgi:hypothetical protein